MSAFVVSDDCMGVILAAVKKYADQLPIHFGESDQDYILNWLGNNLLKFNVQSVNETYHENDEYIDRNLKAKDMGDSFEDLILMAKQVHCWKYQSNNVSGFFHCWPYELMERLDGCICMEILTKHLCMDFPFNDEFDDSKRQIVERTLAYRNCPMWG